VVVVRVKAVKTASSAPNLVSKKKEGEEDEELTDVIMNKASASFVGDKKKVPIAPKKSEGNNLDFTVIIDSDDENKVADTAQAQVTKIFLKEFLLNSKRIRKVFYLSGNLNCPTLLESGAGESSSCAMLQAILPCCRSIRASLNKLGGSTSMSPGRWLGHMPTDG